MISVLIATKDRPHKLRDCLISILDNKYKDFEIIILDQSKSNQTEFISKSLNTNRILYKKLSIACKSKALNQGIKLAHGEVIALTDDDCIVSKMWLRNIEAFFKKNPNVYGLFGQTKPYTKTFLKGTTCPAVFVKDTPATFSKPNIIFYKVLGQGNNLCFRKSLFKKIGFFNEKFGPGAIIPTAEDCELIYRALINKFSLTYSPSVLVYHNRWITPFEETRILNNYSLGISACSVYLYLKYKDLRLLNLLKDKFLDNVIYRLKHIGKKYQISFITHQSWSIIKGVYLGSTLFWS